MSVLSDIQSALTPLGIPLETGVFKDKAPERYIVVVPIVDTFALHADNAPAFDVQEARISFFQLSGEIRILWKLFVCQRFRTI